MSQSEAIGGHVWLWHLFAFSALSALALGLTGVFLAASRHAMQRGRISKKYNILVVNKAVADLCCAGLIWLKCGLRDEPVLALHTQSPMDLALMGFLLVSLHCYFCFSVVKILLTKWPLTYRKKFSVKHYTLVATFCWLLSFLFAILLPIYAASIRSKSKQSPMEDGPPTVTEVYNYARLLSLHVEISVALLINVVLLYQGLNSARAFHQHRGRVKNGNNSTSGNNGLLAAGSNSPRPNGTSTSSPRQASPSILKLYKFALAKYGIRLLSFPLLHLPLVLLCWTQLFKSTGGPASKLLWRLAFAGILVRISVGALIGTFADVEVLKSLCHIMRPILPAHLARNLSLGSTIQLTNSQRELRQNGAQQQQLNGSTLLLREKTPANEEQIAIGEPEITKENLAIDL